MHRILSRSRRVLLIVVAALAVVLTTEAVVLAASKLQNGGAVTAVRTVTDVGEVKFTSLVWNDIPGMVTTVPIPAGETGLLVITFSAQTRCNELDTSDNVFCMVRVLVGGQPANPGEVLFDGAADGDTPFSWETNSMQFVIVKPAANWPVRVQVALDEPSSEFWLGARTLTVLRSKV